MLLQFTYFYKLIVLHNSVIPHSKTNFCIFLFLCFSRNFSDLANNYFNMKIHKSGFPCFSVSKTHTHPKYGQNTSEFISLVFPLVWLLALFKKKSTRTKKFLKMVVSSKSVMAMAVTRFKCTNTFYMPYE